MSKFANDHDDEHVFDPKDHYAKPGEKFEPIKGAYALAPVRPVRTPAQMSAMTFLCNGVGNEKTGYEHIPIEVLRMDPTVHDLLDMLETCRPGRSRGEEDFIEKYLFPFEPYVDDYGNHIITVKPVDVTYPTIMWSCHTDTVHRHGGVQKVEVTNGVAWTSDGSCLGSDDTVGIWLAIQMIKAKVPGVYVFHRDEESGGGGSQWLAREAPDFVGQFDAAIALDRAGYSDVITHQAGGMCASDEFAKSLAKLLGGTFKPDDTGVFTDTANYTDLIGECTNLSVGYFSQHGVREHTNLSFAVSLRDALLAADWTKLVFKRKPGEDDPKWGRYGGYSWGGYDDKWGTFERKPQKSAKSAPAYGSRVEEMEALEDYVREFPWVVAEYLMELGVGIEDLDVYEPGDLT